MADRAPTRILIHDPERLRRRRIEAGFYQRELAEKAGYAVSHLSAMERGIVSTSPPKLRDLADALGCTVADLMPESGVPA